MRCPGRQDSRNSKEKEEGSRRTAKFGNFGIFLGSGNYSKPVVLPFLCSEKKDTSAYTAVPTTAEPPPGANSENTTLVRGTLTNSCDSFCPTGRSKRKTGKKKEDKKRKPKKRRKFGMLGSVNYIKLPGAAKKKKLYPQQICIARNVTHHTPSTECRININSKIILI